jgi:hypothetical protein
VLAPRESGHREGAADRTGGARQAQFAGDQPLAEMIGRELFGGGENAQRNRQVVKRTFLAQISGGEIDGGPRAR